MFKKINWKNNKMKKTLTILIGLFLISCTKPKEAKKALLDSGYTNIKIHGYDPFACGEEDFYSTKFSADAPSGRRVKGCVCQGIFKGKTIRLY